MNIVGIVGGLFVLFCGLVPTAAGIVYLYRSVSIAASDPASPGDTIQSDEPVELEGTAEAVESFEEPISGETAVLSTYTVERYNPGTKEADHWIHRHSDSIRRPFVVTGENGRVAVDPSEATLDLTESPTLTVEDVVPDTVRLRLSQWSEEVDLGSTLGQTDSYSMRLRYSVGRLSAGDDVHVVGAQGVADASGRPTLDAAVGADPEATYRITDGTESTAVSRAAIPGIVLVVVGLLFTAFGVVLLFGSLFAP